MSTFMEKLFAIRVINCKNCLIQNYLNYKESIKLCSPNIIFFYCSTSLMPIFYALIETHKDNFPIRSIVSFIGSATYDVAKFLSHILKKYHSRIFDEWYRLMSKLRKTNNSWFSSHLISFSPKCLWRAATRYNSKNKDFSLNSNKTKIYQFPGRQINA